MKITTKSATLDQMDEINHLLRTSKAYWGYDDKFLDLFIQKIGITKAHLEDEHLNRVVYVDGKMAGFFNFVYKNNCFELDNFFLYPEYIGKGLGRAMWKECCQLAKDQGEKEFVIWSDPDAESFYLKMGCEKIGVRQSPVAPDRYPPLLKFKLPD